MKEERFNMGVVNTIGDFSVYRNDVATVDDAVKLSHGLYIESGETFGFDEVAVRGFIVSVMHAGGLLLVAYSDSGPRGFLLAGRGFNPILGGVTAEEIAIFVHPNDRGGQLGSGLTDMFEAWGIGAGAKALGVTVQDSINHDVTVRFFGRKGYRRQETKLIKEV